MINGKFFVLMLIVFPAVIAHTNYCDRSLCKNVTHIGCMDPPVQFASRCKNPKIMPITQEIRDLIVDTHNMCRYEIAIGFQHFPRPSRMDFMQWNDELAYLALLNVMQCKMKHDDCHNTDMFPRSGQNLALSKWKNENPTVAATVSASLKKWFNEYKDCPADAIDKLYQPSHGKEIYHFTNMIQHRNTHVGCAVLRSEIKNNRTQEVFACNYAFTNIPGQPVYWRA